MNACWACFVRALAEYFFSRLFIFILYSSIQFFARMFPHTHTHSIRRVWKKSISHTHRVVVVVAAAYDIIYDSKRDVIVRKNIKPLWIMWKWNWVAACIRFEYKKSIHKRELNMEEGKVCDGAGGGWGRSGNNGMESVEKSCRDRCLVDLVNY